MDKNIILTEEGYKKLEEELAHLKGARRIEVAERIKTAIEFGDISENSEYDDAKNEQAQLEMKIIDIENILSTAKVVDEDEISTKSVGVGTKVTVFDKEFNEEVEYSIVGANEVNVDENKISSQSPIGEALMGKKKEEEVEIETPGGKIVYQILKIARQ